MRIAAVLALLLAHHPADVTSFGGEILADDSVRLYWTLPGDASVVGVTIFRDRIDGDDDVIRFEIQGLQTEYTDASASPTRSYRYWIHTRDAQGDLSEGVWVEVWGEDDDDDDDDWELSCHATAGAGGAVPIAWALIAGSLAFAARRRSP
jgi:hypothetical protein